MKILIAYATRYGSTRDAAEKIAAELKEDSTIRDLRDMPDIAMDDYDAIIIGGSVYYGKMQREVRDFCLENLGMLLRKVVGIYVCCWSPDEKARVYIEAACPQELVNHAIALGYPGGALQLDKLNMVEQVVARRIIHAAQSSSWISDKKIHEFAVTMDSFLTKAAATTVQ